MKITSLILSIPPYLSTTWKNISSLHIAGNGPLYTLVVLLEDRAEVEIPHLTKEAINQIFEAHARYIEEAEETAPKNTPEIAPFTFSLPLKPNSAFEQLLETSAQHNPEQANLPPLPIDVLKKITMIAKVFGFEDAAALNKPETGCNCIYCQVTRSLQGEDPLLDPNEEVSAEDLKFRDWEIRQTGDKFYCVTNPLDPNEQYNVFLGTPIGCTCGNKSCEHIRAVLTS